MEDLKLDLAEYNSLLAHATRKSVQDHLKKRIGEVEKQILEVTQKPQPVQPPKEESKTQHFQQEQSDDPLIYTPVTKYSWDQEGNKVKIYFSLDGVGDVPKENVIANFQKDSFDLKVKGYKNQNLRFAIKKLCATIHVQSSRVSHGKNTITVTLVKGDATNWAQLQYKESSFNTNKYDAKNEDPQASLMNMMKDMYQNGDEEMKKTIAQAWQKSQAEKGIM